MELCVVLEYKVRVPYVGTRHLGFQQACLYDDNNNDNNNDDNDDNDDSDNDDGDDHDESLERSPESLWSESSSSCGT